jgi:hypothetical protein
MADDDAARYQQLVHHAQAEWEAEVQPHGVADDLSWESVAGVVRAGRCRHFDRLLGLAASRKPGSSQVDGADGPSHIGGAPFLMLPPCPACRLLMGNDLVYASQPAGSD